MTLAEFFYKIRNKPAPYYAKNSIWQILWKPIRKFFNVVLIPNIPYSNLRILFYRIFVGFRIGKNVFIGMKCYLDDLEPNNTIIEDNVTISYGCYFALHGIGQKHTFIHINVKMTMYKVYMTSKCTLVDLSSFIFSFDSDLTHFGPYY